MAIPEGSSADARIRRRIIVAVAALCVLGLVLAVLNLLNSNGTPPAVADGGTSQPSEATAAASATDEDDPDPQVSESVDEPAPATTDEAPSEPASPADSPAETRCDSPEGYSITVPQGWAADDGDAEPCRQFTSVDAGVDDAAVVITVRPNIDTADLFSDYGYSETVSSRTEETVDGHPAVRVESTLTSTGYGGAWHRVSYWMVELPVGSGDAARTLVAVAGEGSELSLEDATAVLDEMMAGVDIK